MGDVAMITATITTPNGTPIDAMQVVFTAPDGTTVTTSTDAGGGIAFEVDGTFTLTMSQALALDGTTYEAGTILHFASPEGAETARLADCLTGVDDASPASLLARIADLTARVAVLEAR